MAKQTLNDGEQGLSFRTKLNNMFTELYTSVASLGTSISDLFTANTAINTTLNDHTTTLNAQVGINSGIATDIAALELVDTGLSNRLNVLENIGITQVAATVPLASFTATTTPTKLTFFNVIPLQDGTASTGNVISQDVTINTNGIYKIAGNIILEFPQTDEISVQLYKNGVAATPAFHQQGLGAGKPVNIGYTTAMALVATDVLTIYVTSNTASFTCTVDGASVLIEKTSH